MFELLILLSLVLHVGHDFLDILLKLVSSNRILLLHLLRDLSLETTGHNELLSLSLVSQQLDRLFCLLWTEVAFISSLLLLIFFSLLLSLFSDLFLKEDFVLLHLLPLDLAHLSLIIGVVVELGCQLLGFRFLQLFLHC